MRYFRHIFIVCLFIHADLYAHPMPNSVLLFDIKSNGIVAELQWPLKELQLAFPNEDIGTHPNSLIARKGDWIDTYLHQHMKITDLNGQQWTITILDKQVRKDQQDYTGAFHELVFRLWFQAPPGVSPRNFMMHYDAIMHQVVTHKMLISLRQDWDGGFSEEDSAQANLGVMMMNTSDNKIPPLIVNLDEGSKWKGFKSMIALGIRHISEGTDHLLFLLVLMLSAPLLASGGKWTHIRGTKYSIIHLLKIVSAFTIGHSLTLLAGAIGWMRLPSQPVEILIALSILVGAVHALKPLFPGREMFVAAAFGLVHGLAFSTTLSSLDLNASRMALSILGFNIGIELMQIFVLLLFVPWIIMLSHAVIYSWLRIIGALFAMVASVAWIFERVTLHSNRVSSIVQSIVEQAPWIILVLALISLITYLLQRKESN